MSQEKPSQSLSITGSSVFGQVGQGVYLNQTQINPYTSTEKQLTSPEVVLRLRDIENLLQGTNLPETEKQTALIYLDAAKKEAQQKEPDKKLTAANLKRVTESLKTASETVDAGKGLWNNVQSIVIPMLGWLGVAKNFFGF